MKQIWVPVILAAAATLGSGAEKRDPNVVVYFHSGNQNSGMVGLAEAQAAHILANAGVSVAWRTGNPSEGGRAEVIEAVLTNAPDGNAYPGALAYATLGPQSGTRIAIFYNRVQAEAGGSAISCVLAHVLVHEITHILEGVNRHSEAGVMKAHWSTEDRQNMRRSSLPFADEDLRLIHEWTERHNGMLLAVR